MDKWSIQLTHSVMVNIQLMDRGIKDTTHSEIINIHPTHRVTIKKNIQLICII